MATTFSSFEELGRKVKGDNPSVTLTDRDAGIKFAGKYPHMATVKEVEDQVSIQDDSKPDQSWGEAVKGGIRAVDQTLQSATNWLPGMSPDNPINKAATDLTQGAMSGASFGLTKEFAKSMDGRIDEDSPYFVGGEIAGEIMGPMSMINKSFGALKATSLLGRAAVATGEGLTTEGIKGAVNYALRPNYEVEDMGAQALIGGGAAGGFDLALRGTARGVSKVASKILGVVPTELNREYINFMRKHGQKIVPTMAAPQSQGARRVLRWMKESAGSADRLRGAADELIKYTNEQKEGFVNRIGGDQITSSRAGRAVVESFEDMHSSLKSDAVEIYKDMIRANPAIRDMPIQANQDIMIPMSDGTFKQVNILRTLEEAVSGVNTDSAKELRDLKRQVDRLAGRTKEGKRAVVMRKEMQPRRSETLQSDISEAQYTPAQAFTRKRLKADAAGEVGDISGARAGKVYDTSLGQTQGGTRSSLQDPTNPGVLAGDVSQGALESAGEKVRQAYDEVEIPEYMTYNDWWKELQTIGTRMGEAKGRQLPGVAGQIGKVYGDVQDAMDLLAENAQPDFSEPIRLARQKYQLYKTVTNNPVVKKLIEFGGIEKPGGSRGIEKFSRLAGELFNDIDAVREAKRVLPPEQFDMLRSAHVQDLLWNARAGGDIKEANIIERFDFDKLIEVIERPGERKRGGLNGEYWNELFSDEGFSDVFGDVVEYDGGGGQLHEQFKELVRLAAVTDVQAGSLKPGSEGFSSAMAENFAPGVVVKDPLAHAGMLQGLIANILTTKKFAKDFFEQDLNKNMYLQGQFKGELPDMLTGKGNVAQLAGRSSLTNLLTAGTGVR
tara:strand:+ start:6809 stop:9319 length:2511 start_codon:yes stop_codon:yes gene_type:complete